MHVISMCSALWQQLCEGWAYLACSLYTSDAARLCLSVMAPMIKRGKGVPA
jgi:hypothetical protein